MNNLFFEVKTPLNFTVRTTSSYWELIVSVKHPSMKGLESFVINTLENPDEIRQSLKDSAVYLFYKIKSINRWICVVTKQLNGEGFLITTYPTNAIKEGVRIWHK